MIHTEVENNLNIIKKAIKTLEHSVLELKKHPFQEKKIKDIELTKRKMEAAIEKFKSIGAKGIFDDNTGIEAGEEKDSSDIMEEKRLSAALKKLAEVIDEKNLESYMGYNYCPDTMTDPGVLCLCEERPLFDEAIAMVSKKNNSDGGDGDSSGSLTMKIGNLDSASSMYQDGGYEPEFDRYEDSMLKNRESVGITKKMIDDIGPLRGDG